MQFFIDPCLFLPKHYNSVVILISLYFRDSLSSAIEHSPCLWLHASFGNECAAKLQAAVPLNISSTVGGQPDPLTILLTVQCNSVFISQIAGHLVQIIPVAEGPSTDNGAQLLNPGQSFHEAAGHLLIFGMRSDEGFLLLVVRHKEMPQLPQNLNLQERVDFQSSAAWPPCSLLISFYMCIRIHFVVTLKPLALFLLLSVYSCFS